MNFWWVNQNLSWKHEIAGGYLWSPKCKKNGAKNYFYDTMKKVKVGDIIFSFYRGKIQQLGIATHEALSISKPKEFDDVDADWNKKGWLVKVSWHKIPTPFRPSNYIEAIRPFLPEKYAPLRKNGLGLQVVYLTAIANDLAAALLAPIRDFGQSIMRIAASQSKGHIAADQLRDEDEELIVKSIRDDREIPETEKQSLIMSRRGQGKFRANLEAIENGCRFTEITDRRLLRASHIKPWRDCENKERLDGNNGLLLTPHFDHLFDSGFISFDAKGRVLVSPQIIDEDLHRLCGCSLMGKNIGPFSVEQTRYLQYHRKHIFLKSLK